MTHTTPAPLRTGATLMLLTLLGACDNASTETVVRTVHINPQLRSQYTQIAAQAHLQVDTFSKHGAHATSRAYALHQAAQSTQHTHDTQLHTRDDCSVSGHKRTDYRIHSEKVSAGDTLTTRLVACADTPPISPTLGQTFSTGVDSWYVLSGTVNDKSDLKLTVHHIFEQTATQDDGEQSLRRGDLSFDLLHDKHFRYFKIREGEWHDSKQGITQVHNFEQRVLGSACERSYDLAITLATPDLANVSEYRITTLSPTQEVHVLNAAGEVRMQLLEGKIRLSLDNGALIEYSAVGENSLLVSLDENADGVAELQQRFSYQSFLAHAQPAKPAMIRASLPDQRG